MNQTLTCVTSTPSFDRGREFVSSDGSAVTFWSDTSINDNATSFPTGNLIFPDGRVYRIEEGSVKWIRDRNGNQLRFRYDGFSRISQVTDSLERDVFVAYSVPCGADNCDEISYTGASGSPRVIRIRVNNLAAPGVLGAGLGPVQLHEVLFDDFPFAGQGWVPDGESEYATNEFDPIVVTAVELPNDQQYSFQYNPYGELFKVTLPTGGGFEYDWRNGVYAAPIAASGGVLFNGDGQGIILRRVEERRTYKDGSTLEGKTTYTRDFTAAEPITTAEIRQYDGLAVVAMSKLYYHGKPRDTIDNQAFGFLDLTQYSS